MVGTKTYQLCEPMNESFLCSIFLAMKKLGEQDKGQVTPNSGTMKQIVWWVRIARGHIIFLQLSMPGLAHDWTSKKLRL